MPRSAGRWDNLQRPTGVPNRHQARGKGLGNFFPFQPLRKLLVLLNPRFEALGEALEEIGEGASAGGGEILAMIDFPKDEKGHTGFSLLHFHPL